MCKRLLVVALFTAVKLFAQEAQPSLSMPSANSEAATLEPVDAALAHTT